MSAEKMKEYLQGLPEQFGEILQMKIEIPGHYQRAYHNVVVSGLGGSAIGGDILRTCAIHQAAIPVLVNRDYDIPAFVDEKTLFLAVSYSGNTEETLSAYRQARQKNAAIIVVSSGGKLSAMASEDGCFVIEVPGGLSPRAASGYLFSPLAIILDQLNILTGTRADLQETQQVLTVLRAEIGPEADAASNIAKQLATQMKNHIPVIWGSASHSETTALRWKGQINENAKSPAYYNIFPELNHNEIVGFEAPEELLSRLFVVMLRDPGDHERVKRRMEISRGIIQDHVAGVAEVEARGKSFLARFYSLAYIGDYVSFYLAQEYGINPTPVKVIDYLKAELAKNE